MRSTATVCVILACVGGALSTHDGNPHGYQSLAASPCGDYPPSSFKTGADDVNLIALKKYTTNGGEVDGQATESKGQLWDDIKLALKLLEPLDSHKATYGGGLNGWTPDQHEYVIWLSQAVAAVEVSDMTIGGVAKKNECQRLQKDLSTIYVNIEKLSNADRRTADHTDAQHTDSSVSVNKRPWHSVAAALTIVGLANTIQKY